MLLSIGYRVCLASVGGLGWVGHSAVSPLVVPRMNHEFNGNTPEYRNAPSYVSRKYPHEVRSRSRI